MRYHVYRSIVPLTVLLVFGIGATALAAESPGYLRYPDIHGEQVVFTAEADLWLAPVSGGLARRLTSHVGNEFFPHFSPDGARIAFTGAYDGNQDVYVVGADGGEPRRLTWNPDGDEVVGWMPDGESIVFRSRREEPHGEYELFTIPAGGGEPRKLPLGWATRIDVDPETGAWAFTRTERERRTWKRYRGGTATKIWVGDPDRADFREVSTFDGKNAFPMWHGGRIYHLSDPGGTVDVWSMKADGSDRQRHTDGGDWDARFPSMGPDGRIVFMRAGDIHLFDPSSGTERKLDIRLPSDRVLTRVRYPDAGRFLDWFELSPDGKRVAVTTRGKIFSVPVDDGVTLPVTRGSGSRERYGWFDRDGKRIVYITDEPLEEEIRIIDSWGRGEAEVVKPAAESGWYFAPKISPDGKWVAYADDTQTLFIVPTGGGEPRKVDHSEQSEIRDYTWSPDGRWLAYWKDNRLDLSSIWVYDAKENTTHRITGETTNDRSPAWDPEGRYLYFLSDRNMNPLLGFFDLNYVGIKPTQIYAVLLRDDVDNPFVNAAGLPPQDEEKKDDAEEDGEDADKKKKKGKKDEREDDDGDKKKDELKPVEIDFEGIAERIAKFPVEPGFYFGLGATKANVFYVSAPIRGMAEGPGFFQEAAPTASLMSYNLDKKKAKSFMGGISTYSLAPGADKIAVMKRRGEVYVVGAGSPPGDLSEAKLDLGNVVIDLDPREEWKQIYYEAWRHMREFYWDAGMAGVDWKKVRDQYATLLPRLATRDDLRDLIGELIGEMSTSHTYVFGGDPGVRAPRVPVGLLGADVVRDGEFFRVERIYYGDPLDNVVSPLQEAGVGVSEGDYILAVNHTPFPEGRPFLASLEGLAGKETLLTVNDKPSREEARDVVVTPLRRERRLRYVDWVRRNREYVAEKSDGKIGYVHIPNMGTEGLVAFHTWFFPQLDRQGMVVDTRWNGGGFVSEVVLERFRRSVLAFGLQRGGAVSTYPYRTLNGPFVVLTNEHAGSDGDIFPAAVQLEGLAPVIGTRSWGGVVGIRADKRTVDGGIITEPEFAWWDPAKGWDLENRGVDPDIVVQNLPQDLAKGVDDQLDRGIAEVLRLLEENPPPKPEFGPARPRGREDYRDEEAD